MRTFRNARVGARTARAVLRAAWHAWMLHAGEFAILADALCVIFLAASVIYCATVAGPVRPAYCHHGYGRMPATQWHAACDR